MKIKKNSLKQYGKRLQAPLALVQIGGGAVAKFNMAMASRAGIGQRSVLREVSSDVWAGQIYLISLCWWKIENMFQGWHSYAGVVQTGSIRGGYSVRMCRWQPQVEHWMLPIYNDELERGERASYELKTEFLISISLFCRYFFMNVRVDARWISIILVMKYFIYTAIWRSVCNWFRGRRR